MTPKIPKGWRKLRAREMVNAEDDVQTLCDCLGRQPMLNALIATGLGHMKIGDLARHLLKLTIRRQSAARKRKL